MCDIIDDIGDTISNAWDNLMRNPIGAITSAVAMAYGIPPMWAGALGGATGAAATGGDVVKGAFTGGAMGYMGNLAGTYVGASSPIIAGMAAGATAGVTGAVLTGGDVMAALKSGLILGGVSGGVAKFMTPEEAISSVSSNVLRDASATADPLGYLIDEMGWTSSDSAIAAASQAFSKNIKTSQAALADSVPDYLLQQASTLPANIDKATFIANELGWTPSNVTIGAANNAIVQYKAANTVATGSTPEGIRVNNLERTGLVDNTQAKILDSAGYTATDVENLVKLGYNSNDLVDLASTGVPANTLTNLAKNTSFAESTINDLLSSGVDATTISNASNFVKNGQITASTAEQLMNKGFNAEQIRNYSVNGIADKVLQASNNGLTNNNIDSLINNNFDLNKINTAFDEGTLNSNTLNVKISGGNYAKQLSSDLAPKPVIPDITTTAPVIPLTPAEILANTGLVNSVDSQVLINNGYTLNDVQQLSNLGYNPSDLADLASIGIKPSTLTSLSTNTNFTETQINNMLSNNVSANDIGLANQQIGYGSLRPDTATTLLNQGVDPSTILKITNAGISADNFANLVNSGVDPNSLIDFTNNTPFNSNMVNDLLSKNVSISDINDMGQFVNQGTVGDMRAYDLLSKGVTTNDFVQGYENYVNGRLLDVGNGNYLDPQGNITDQYGIVTSKMPTPGPGTEYAAGPSTTITDQPYRVELSGGAKWQDNPPPADYKLPQGTRLATLDEMELGQRGTGPAYVTENSTWVVPTGELAPLPFVDIPPTPTIPNVDVTGAPMIVNPPVTQPIEPSVPSSSVVQILNPANPAQVSPPVNVTGGTNVDINQPIVPVMPPVVPPSVTTPPITAAPVTTPVTTPVTAPPTSVYNPDTGMTEITTPGTGTNPVANVTLTPGNGTGTGTGTGTNEGPVVPVIPPVVTPPVVTPPVVTLPPPVVTPPPPAVTEPPIDATEIPHHDVPPEEPIVEDPNNPTLPIVPIVPPLDNTTPPTDNTHYGTFTVGEPWIPKIPTGLNPGWIAPTPYYTQTNPAQSKFYWGTHPYQPGPTFSASLYNTLPYAPKTPWGATVAPQAATYEQVLAAMQGRYPLLGNTGPVAP